SIVNRDSSFSSYCFAIIQQPANSFRPADGGKSDGPCLWFFSNRGCLIVGLPSPRRPHNTRHSHWPCVRPTQPRQRLAERRVQLGRLDVCLVLICTRTHVRSSVIDKRGSIMKI